LFDHRVQSTISGMVAKNLLESVLALPVEDRMELLERLRENLRNDPALLPLTPEHQKILDERLTEFEGSPDEGSSWEEVEARIRSNVGGP